MNLNALYAELSKITVQQKIYHVTSVTTDMRHNARNAPRAGMTGESGT